MPNEPSTPSINYPSVPRALRYIARHPESAKIMAVFAQRAARRASGGNALTADEVAELLDYAISHVEAKQERP
jgi:hypothetical protein